VFEEKEVLVEQGQGQHVLVLGEAGIGKSRLVQEVKKHLSAKNWLVLQGNCYESDTNLPYAPFQDLIRQILLSPLQEEFVGLLGVAPPELARLFPDLAPWFPATPAGPGFFESELLKYRLTGTLLQIVTALAKRQPVLLVFEDLHWSDQNGLDALLHLARRLSSQPILLLLTCRVSETGGFSSNFLAELNRERLVTELELHALSLTEVSTLLAAIFELPRPIRAEFLTTLYRFTEGNPFFLEEVLRTLIAAGDIFFQNGGWERKPVAELRIPKSVQDAVQTRLHHLSLGSRELLNLGAVIGREFSLNLLLKLSGLDSGPLLAQLKELLEAQLIAEADLRTDYFTFRHALTREAVYSKLLTLERRKLHLAIANMLEQEGAEAVEENLEQLAYHFYKAANWEKTARYAWQAAEWAFSLHSFPSVIEQTNRYLEAARQLALPVAAGLYRLRGSAFETLGELEKARESYEAALTTAREQADKKAEWQSLSDLGQYWLGHNYEMAGEYFNHGLELARQLADPRLLATSFNRLGNWLANTGRPGEAIVAHRQALTLFETAADKTGTVETLEVLGMAQAVQGDMQSAFEAYEKACPLFLELGDEQRLVTSLVMRAVSSSPAYCSVSNISPRSLAESQNDFETAFALTRRLDWFTGQAFTGFEWGFVLAAFGEFGRADTSLREALELAKNIGHIQWAIASQVILGWLYLNRLDGEGAVNILKPAYEEAQKLGSAIWGDYSIAWLSRAYLLSGNLAEAGALLARHFPANHPARNIGERMISLAWGELEFFQEDYAGALEIAEQLITTASNHIGQLQLPALFRLKGEALQGLGKPGEAIEALEAAKNMALGLDARPELWQNRVSLGNLLLKQNRQKEAGEELAAARTLIRELAEGIAEVADRAKFLDAAFKGIPAEKKPATRSNPKSPGKLTGREGEIAALIAEGKSNLEIAESLVLSKRTVETHITNILTKLDFSSRAQVAVWATRNNLAK
jgi:DNA-binding CsgD family transcriptional regulator